MQALRHAELLFDAMGAERGTRLPSAARYAMLRSGFGFGFGMRGHGAG